MTSTKIRKAVFPVAGMGTRLLPATKVMPKEMLTLVDRPLIQHAVDEAIDAGINEFIFVTAPHKAMLEHHFAIFQALEDTLAARGKTDMLKSVQDCNLPAGSLRTVQQSQALGLGHAVWCARDLVGHEPFAVLLPDDVFLPGRSNQGCMAQLMDAYQNLGGNVCVVVDVPREQTSRYGIIKPGADHGDHVEITGMVEKPRSDAAPSTLSIMGRYILQPSIFDHLAKFETGTGGEIQLTDAMAKLIGHQPFNGVRYDGTRYDCGTKLGFIETNLAFALKDPDIGVQVRDIVRKLVP